MKVAVATKDYKAIVIKSAVPVGTNHQLKQAPKDMAPNGCIGHKIRSPFFIGCMPFNNDIQEVA